jgi:prophage regulatory protein
MRQEMSDLNQADVVRVPAPGARLLRLPEVMARVGLRRSAIYQRMSEGRFPRSRSLGPKCAVWVEAEIDEWIRDVAARVV